MIRTRRAGALAAALLALAATPARPSLRARFLGNEAFEITDGRATLLTDFPYESGAFGYMEYDPAELHARPDSLCLFTHAHADHFAPSLVARIGCRVFGPAPVLAAAPRGTALAPGADGEVAFGEIRIRPIATRHGDAPHLSYRVAWAGSVLYFAGDTDDPRPLAAEKRLDGLFVSPWLLAAARRAGTLPPAERLVVYHQRREETIPPGNGRIVPSPGETIVIR